MAWIGNGWVMPIRSSAAVMAGCTPRSANVSSGWTHTSSSRAWPPAGSLAPAGAVERREQEVAAGHSAGGRSRSGYRPGTVYTAYVGE